MAHLIRLDLVSQIKKHAKDLVFPEVFVVDDTLEPVDPQVFLGAISLNESSGGYNNRPVFEKAYAPGGRYYNAMQKALYEKYGPPASCSHSSFQLMFVCFYEMGFKPAPEQASDDEYAMPAIVKFMNKRVLKGDLNFLCQAGDAYNTGNYHDLNIPREYIKRLLQNYHRAMDSGLFDITIDRDAPKPWPGNIK